MTYARYPCRDCTERHQACHDTCEKYLEAKKKMDEANSIRKKETEYFKARAEGSIRLRNSYGKRREGSKVFRTHKK